MAQVAQTSGKRRIFQAESCDVLANPQAFFGAVDIRVQDPVNIFCGVLRVFSQFVFGAQDIRLILSMIPVVDLLLM
jgi:hypothetical protein